MVVAYGAGAALIALRWLVGLARLRRLARGAGPVPPWVAALFDAVAGREGRRVRLLMTDRLDLPLTFGWRAPVILLPAAWCREGDEAALRYGLAHEWSHVERHDLGRWHLATVVGLLFYWQPLFWWLRRQLRLGQDYLADSLAARQAGASEDYAAYLVGLARRALGVPPCGALGIADRRSNLYRRVIMLVNNREPLQRRCSGLWSVAALAVTVVVAGAVSAVRLDAGDAAAPEKDAPKKEAPKVEPPPLLNVPSLDPKEKKAAKTADVGGAVTVDGKGLPAGFFVTLVSAEGKRFTTIVQKEGVYRFGTAIPVGPYRVAVEPALGTDAKVIPARYQDAATSGLVIQVGTDKANTDLRLTK